MSYLLCFLQLKKTLYDFCSSNLVKLDLNLDLDPDPDPNPHSEKLRDPDPGGTMIADPDPQPWLDCLVLKYYLLKPLTNTYLTSWF